MRTDNDDGERSSTTTRVTQSIRAALSFERHEFEN